MGVFKENLISSADPALGTVVDASVIGQMMAIDGDVSDYDDNTDSLEALADGVSGATTSVTDAVPEPPTANSLQDILHKDGNYTYDNTTDSLEAIRDKSNLIQPAATDNLNTIAASQATNLDLARAGNSGTTTMDGSELPIYEETDTTAFIFEGGYIDWTGLNFGAAEDTIIKAYAKIVSGGSYVQFYEETFLAAALPAPLLVPVPRDINTQCVPRRLANTYGVKITATQGAVGAGWNDIVFEAYDAKAGG